MAQDCYKVSASGSLMLTGEHAVLHGYPALVCAINKRLHVTLTPREDSVFSIISEQLGDYKADIKQIKITPPFELILTIIQHYQPHFKQGFDLEITSEFPSIGLGSSGALIMASLQVFEQWLFAKPLEVKRLLDLGITLMHKTQRLGSGADLVASLLGGAVLYQANPLSFKKLNHLPPISVIYSGEKIATEVVVKQVNERAEKYPALWKHLYSAIGECTQLAYHAIQAEDWKTLGDVFNRQHALLSALGVNTDTLDQLVKQLWHDPAVLGAKLSGAGMGDCVIGVGNCNPINLNLDENMQYLDLAIDYDGIGYE